MRVARLMNKTIKIEHLKEARKMLEFARTYLADVIFFIERNDNASQKRAQEQARKKIKRAQKLIGKRS